MLRIIAFPPIESKRFAPLSDRKNQASELVNVHLPVPLAQFLRRAKRLAPCNSAPIGEFSFARFFTGYFAIVYDPSKSRCRIDSRLWRSPRIPEIGGVGPLRRNR